MIDSLQILLAVADFLVMVKMLKMCLLGFVEIVVKLNDSEFLGSSLFLKLKIRTVCVFLHSSVGT